MVSPLLFCSNYHLHQYHFIPLLLACHHFHPLTTITIYYHYWWPVTISISCHPYHLLSSLPDCHYYHLLPPLPSLATAAGLPARPYCFVFASLVWCFSNIKVPQLMFSWLLLSCHSFYVGSILCCALMFMMYYTAPALSECHTQCFHSCPSPVKIIVFSAS